VRLGREGRERDTREDGGQEEEKRAERATAVRRGHGPTLLGAVRPAEKPRVQSVSRT
jgi:hypothetical protein